MTPEQLPHSERMSEIDKARLVELVKIAAAAHEDFADLPLKLRNHFFAEGVDQGTVIGTAPCDAWFYHGPGYPFRTRCHLTGKHETHEAIYGSLNQVAHWFGYEGASDHLDQPQPPKRPESG